MSYIVIIFLLGLLIFIHELGHFSAARIAGVRIARFSVGFGPKLWSKKIGGTEYRVSAIPLGGYVLPEITELSELYLIPWRSRIFYVLGGPMANFLFAAFSLLLMNLFFGEFSFYNIFVAPLVKTWSLSLKIISSIPLMFTQTENMSGIVGIVTDGSRYVGLSFARMLQFSTLLSINLAIFNMLPFPPLDGGNLLLYLLEKIDRRLLKLHIPVALTGWLLLIGFMVYATIMDISRVTGGAVN